jgi:hypothetical protein
MFGNKTAIVSCFYTNLHGTKFGGRAGIEARYINSFKSLLKIDDADFHVFCDPNQTQFLYESANLKDYSNVRLIEYDLENFYLQDLFTKYKDYGFSISESNRCQEIQYNKAYWMRAIAEEYENYDNIFWIDMGISYSGLIPDKHLIFEANKPEYYNSSLFTNKLIQGLISYTADKYFLMMIHNHEPLFYRKILYDFFDHENEKHHAIAGILGGDRKAVIDFFDMFKSISYLVAEHEKQIYDEETILQVLYERNKDFFADLRFETWYHEDNALGIASGDDQMFQKLIAAKSFYQALEELHSR